MKKKLSLVMASALLLSALAGTASAAPKKNTITMTIPSSYGSVYDRLVEAFGKEYYDYDLIEEVIVEEAPVEEVVVEEAPVEEVVVEEAPVAEAVVEESVAAVQTGDGSGDYSKTNVQVAGIDEGDIVKTDGEYIYVLKMDVDVMLILDADGADTEVLSRKKTDSDYTIESETYDRNYRHNEDYRYESLGEDPVELYVYGDRAAVVLDCSYSLYTRTNGVRTEENTDYTLIKIYDVSDPEKPLHIASLGQSGTYEASRMIDGKIYLLTDHRDVSLVERENYENYIPSLYHNDTKELVPVNSIVCPPEIHAKRYTVISEYSLADCDVTATKSVLTPTDTVYMNGEHLYLADEYSYTDVLDERTESVYHVKETVSGRRTDIYKFALGEKIVTKAFCTVDGQLLNQFSMDEYNGNLRLVTTHQTTSSKVYTDETYGFTNTRRTSSEQTNGLYIYDENLDSLGSVTGLAADERVYSVRFDGDVGYFVTFRQVDPLFAVDLSNPREPEIMSALKIPGFSKYLHPYSDTLLFGLGQEATLTGRTTGMKLSMFDTSDPYDVIERDKLVLDIGSSTALNNHKAILIAPDRGIIGFPSEDGYVLYGYSTDKGFYEIIRTGLTGKYKWDKHSRGLYIGDTFYIVTQKQTIVLDMETYEITATVSYSN